MNPLIAIAASILPEILKAVVGERAGSAGGIVKMVAKAVENAAGSAEPEAARAALDADPKAAADLKIRLAEIAAEAEDARRASELEMRELELRDSEARQQARLDDMKAALQADEARRTAELARLKTGLADTRHARAALSELARAASPMAWGAPAVSVIVALGFFVILGAMIALPGLPSLNADSPVFQIINVAIGALATAFATVVSFWLGSSQGSRAKDAVMRDIAPWRPAPAGDGSVELSGPGGDAPKGPGTPRPGSGSRFEACVDIVLAHEGGYSDHRRDPGGATRWGITQAALEAWRGGKVSKAEVKRLSQDEAREIYFANYWNALKCDGLPAGIDLMVFDLGVNAGPGRAARLLQRLAGAHADGAIGRATIEAVRRLEPADLIRRYAAARLDYYRGLSTWNTFGRGWTRRTQAVERAALAMAG